MGRCALMCLGSRSTSDPRGPAIALGMATPIGEMMTIAGIRQVGR
jgi:hypothetical protein